MRKLVCLLVAGLVLLPATASAAPRIRTDPDDTPIVLDIRQIITASHTRRTLLGITTYDPFEATTLYENFIQFNLDTKGRIGFDYYLEFGYARRTNTLFCVFLSDVDFDASRIRADLDPAGGVSCSIPTRWLDIQKEVRFSVVAYLQGQEVDRAPGFGWYRGL
jgi:hypothetical protein